MDSKLTKDSKLKEILELKKGEEILTKHGVPCVSCAMAKFEMEKLKLGEISEIYGLNLDAILEDLNK